VLTALAIGAAGSLGAAAGLLAVFGIAVRQAIGVTARIRAAQAAGGAAQATGDGAQAAARASDGERAQRVRLAAAAGAGQLACIAAVTVAVMLPFIVIGDAAGTELLHTAAAVICGGLITTALVSLYALPVPFLRLSPAAAPSPAGPPLGSPPGVPPGEEPGGQNGDRAADPGRVPPSAGVPS
jgi:Cu/Ag efflux pump CusA